MVQERLRILNLIKTLPLQQTAQMVCILVGDVSSICMRAWRSERHLGDHFPVALEEGLDLRTDGCGHAVLRHKVHILPLVLVCHLLPNHSVSATILCHAYISELEL